LGVLTSADVRFFRDRGIDPELAAARPYVTDDAAKELEQLAG
jgi:hypothetical protein